MDEERLTPSRGSPKRSLTMNTLKYIAIAAMVVDHTAFMFVQSDALLYFVMRLIGRVAGPLLLFAAVEGYHHTKNINKYMLRLALFALVSYFPYVYFEAGGVLAKLDFTKLNVIYTLFLSIAALRVFRAVKNPVLKAVLLFVLIILSIPGDWGVLGILIVLVFEYFYGNFKQQAFGYCLVIFLKVGILNVLTTPFYELYLKGQLTTDFSVYRQYLMFAGLFIPIILLRFYNRQKGSSAKFSKWFFYIFYPLHLLILGFLHGVL